MATSRPPGRCSLGLFHDDTRILSGYDAAGGRGAAAAAVGGSAAHVRRADRPGGEGPAVRRRSLGSEARCSHPPRAGALRRPGRAGHAHQLSRRSRSSSGSSCRWRCDFADIFEVRGWRRAERGQFFAPEPAGDRLLFRYRGRDGRTIGSVVRFLQPPDLLTARRARWDFTLASQIPLSLNGRYSRTSAERAPAGSRAARFDERRAAVERHYRTWRQAGSRWTTDVPKFDVVLRRATDDLRALYMEVDGEDVISAGIPWYSTVFGRDSIITSLETLRAQSRHRARHAALPGPPTGRARGSVHRGAARPHPPRAAPGRDGPRGRDPARALLRHRGRDPALAGAAARDLALDRRRRAGARS